MSDEKKKLEASEEDGTEDLSSRRKALRNILLTGGVAAGASFLPEKWTKPAVDFVVVPAHAATSTTFPTMSPTTIE